jgi:hypothetical protein
MPLRPCRGQHPRPEMLSKARSGAPDWFDHQIPGGGTGSQLLERVSHRCSKFWIVCVAPLLQQRLGGVLLVGSQEQMGKARDGAGQPDGVVGVDCFFKGGAGLLQPSGSFEEYTGVECGLRGGRATGKGTALGGTC